MDVQALEKGSCKGEIIIKADENKMPAFALYSLDWTFEGDTKKARSEIKVLSGSSAMVTLNIASEDGEDPKVSAPQPMLKYMILQMRMRSMSMPRILI